MSIEIELPNLGEGIDGGDIADILVSEGDVIEANQIIMEIETDKAVLEVPSPQGGTVEKIAVASGDEVKVGQTLIVVSGSTTSDSTPAPESKAAEPAEEQAEESSPAESAPTATSGKTEFVTGSVDFELPNLGEGIDSADIAEVTVSDGDVIEAGDVIMELETDKAVMELPCPHGGKITKLHVAEGDTVKVGAKVLTIESSSTVGDTGSSAPTEAPPAEAPQEASTPAPTQVASAPTTSSAVSTASDNNGIPVPASPSTRRLARQLGVDLKLVKGSASGGRITAEDVQGFVKGTLQNTDLTRTSSGSSNQLIGGITAPPLPDFSKYGLIEREKMNKLSRTAAENLTVSWNVIPHVTQHDRVDITDLEAARKKFGKGIGKNGPKVTMTAIVMKALATCLQANPKFNSSLDPETNEIILKKFYNLGCAVDTPNGLVVPVVRDCDQKSILQIAADITDLAVRARDRKLKIDEMQGATCTITNLGGIGGVAFTPIVNYPEVCILGMCRGQKELQMVDGQIQERLMLPLSLSYDHRVINGADAARFVVTLTNLLGDPFQLLTTV